jgi:flagellar biosynthesis chaperone FliJ
MSGRGTRLGNLLRIRQIQERAARAEVLRLSAEAEAAEQKALVRQHRYDTEERHITVDAETWHDLRFSRDAQAAGVRAAFSTAQSARTVERAGREKWTGTNQRAHVMEKLVESVLAREAADQARAEQRAVDDRSGARWLASDASVERARVDAAEDGTDGGDHR